MMKRWVFHLVFTLSALVCFVVGLLWLRTEAMGTSDTVVWGSSGVYHCLEFSSDDLKYKILYDPGLPRRSLRWFSQRGGWLLPPAPSNRNALPRTSVTWVLPQPRSEFFQLETRRLWLSQLGFDYAEFAGWYGPGTTLHSYRLSYFAILLPAAILPLCWAGRRVIHRLRHRHPPGHCRRCGYDLRASRERCPECGTAIPAGDVEKERGGGGECAKGGKQRDATEGGNLKH